MGYHIPLFSPEPSPLNFNEQRFAHFKLSSDLCHQHVRSKQILKATMWAEVARGHIHTRSNFHISVKSHSNSLLSISMKWQRKVEKLAKKSIVFEEETLPIVESLS